VAIGRGDVVLTVVESGNLESADTAPAKCQVEALTGAVGGQPSMAGGRQATTKAAPATASASASAAAAPAAVKQAATGTAAAPGAAGAAGAAGKAAAAPAASTAQAVGLQVPVIASFTYTVPPHTPLRPAIKANTVAQLKTQLQPGGGGNQPTERPGSTRILSILPEGTRVQTGDIVCELDSAAFRDELLAQIIRYDQAKAWVDQARSTLKVSQITLEEYRKGTLEKDRLALEGYIRMCENQREQAKQRLSYSKDLFAKKLMTPQQFNADLFALERYDLAMSQARGMQNRLENYTAPRLIKNLEAKIDAVQADLLAQEAAFQLEKERKEKLERNIEHCTMRASRNGIVVYAKPANAWGRVEAQIMEGVTVRDGQAIFNLPDPSRMRVRAKINESKVALIESGQATRIVIDAFPDQPLRGEVAEVTPIPSAAAGPISDVKIYYAMVDIDGGFDGLRTGLSAEVSFQIDARRDVVRVPLRTVRWFNDVPHVALTRPHGGYTWRSLKLGLSDEHYAEVLSGLTPGDRVVANPETLTPPKPRQDQEFATTDVELDG
jgi:multidrug resistance efflux pump